MPQEPALDRVPEGVKISPEEWAFFSEKSRRFVVAWAARYREMERLLAERERSADSSQQERSGAAKSGS